MISLLMSADYLISKLNILHQYLILSFQNRRSTLKNDLSTCTIFHKQEMWEVKHHLPVYTVTQSHFYFLNIKKNHN